MGKEAVKVICVGSRKSRLALIQTRHVITLLQKIFPKEKFEIHTMTTMGDRVLHISLPKIGEKALFTKDLEDALISGRVDFVVHSLKDLPTVLPDGMAIGAILEREDPRDALVLRVEHAGLTLQTLPAGSVIGTSSLRRGAQLARKYPQLVVRDIRGNLDTRLAKLNDKQSEFAGIILAQAGLERMGWHDRISQTLDADDILYAVGQGALAVECRSSDKRILGMLQQLSCQRTQCRILAERSFLKTLGGGCSAPVAVITELKRYGGEAGGDGDADADDENELHITGAVWSLDGLTEVQSKLKCSLKLSAKRAIGNGGGDAAEVDEENSGDVPLPAKRARVSATPVRGDSKDSSNGSDGDGDQPRKPASPTVVDDTPAPRLPNGADMNDLVRIHGDLLRKCPFTATHHALNGDGDKCPMNGVGLVVGQDVMGECPYLNAEQKVVASQVVTSAAAGVMGQCPFSAADRAKLTAAAAAAGPATGGANATKPAAVGCPFAKSASVMAVEGDAGVAKAGCPFLKQSSSGVASVSCVRPQQLQDEGIVAAAAAGDEDDAAEGRLFCGLYRHDCYALDLFERCERLGQQLAKTLIENGASTVMECAQKEIRKGI